MAATTTTPHEPIKGRIARHQARENELVEEAFRLGEQEYAAQSEGDRRRVVAVRARGEELPQLIGEAKAAKLDAMADLEALQAREHYQLAVPQAEQVNAIECEIEQLQSERTQVRNARDDHWAAAKKHRLQATELRHQAAVLRGINDPRKLVRAQSEK